MLNSLILKQLLDLLLVLLWTPTFSQIQQAPKKECTEGKRNQFQPALHSELSLGYCDSRVSAQSAPLDANLLRPLAEPLQTLDMSGWEADWFHQLVLEEEE